MNNPSFQVFDNTKAGLLFDDSTHPKYPIRYYNIINGDGLERVDNEPCSWLGFVYEGSAVVQKKVLPPVIMKAGMFFSITEFDWWIRQGLDGTGPYGKVVIIQVLHERGVYPQNKYRAMDLFGVVEKEGRLAYIDGCTDSLLIPPIKLGDPCLNHLHFPAGIDQTAHTHPSHRIGIVSSGHGVCKTPFGDAELSPGTIFVIKEWNGTGYSYGLDGNLHEDGTHKFATGDTGLDVIAFHPDSDFGPTDINHPMINRTIVGGVSASELPEIQTKNVRP